MSDMRRMPARADGRSAFERHRFALAFVVVVALPLFVLPLLREEVFVVRDHFDYFQPLRWFTAQELRSGQLPLWNPYSASGEPWLANPQTGVFYPPAWLFLLLPFATAYVLFLYLHVVLLGWGTYLLLSRSVSRGAALVGGVSVIFSGPVVSLLDVQNNLATLAWMPFALWCAAAGAWRRASVVLALAFLAGEPFFAALVAAMFAILSLASAPRGGKLRAAGKVALAGAGAFGIAAVQLLPFLEMVRGSDRAAGMDSALILRDSMPLRDWLRVAVPPRLDTTLADPSLGQHFIPVVYVGLAVLMLAAAGLTALLRRRDVIGWGALLVFAVLVSSGPAILTKMPLTLFRYPARFVPLAAFALAGLAAIGWERIRADRRWLDLIVVLVIAGDLLHRGRPLLRSATHRADVVPYDPSVGAEAKILRVGEIDPQRRASWMSGYLNLYQRRFEAFTPAPLAAERYVAMHRQLQSTPTREQLQSLAVGWVLTTYPLEGPFVAAGRSSGVTMFRYTRGSSLALLRTREGAQPLRAEVGTSRARVVVDSKEGGLVVLSQQSAPGWSVTVDGERANGVVVEGLFRGVRVPGGRHEVVWWYRPPSLFAGAIMTLVTLLTMAWRAFVKRPQRENFSSFHANAE